MSKVLLGLDIGSQLIKVVVLTRDKNKSSLLGAAYIPNPVLDVLSMSKLDEQELARSINKLAYDMKVSNLDVCTSLPASKVITRVVEVPFMSDDEMKSSMQWEAEQYVPFPLSKVKLDFAVLEKNVEKKKMRVLLVAAPLILIEKYMNIITLAGLNPVAIETEILASIRSIQNCFPTLSNILVLSIGATTTELALLHSQQIIHTQSYQLGGNLFTRAIAEELNFELSQAEEYKKSYGMDASKLEGKIAKIIQPIISNLYTEIEKTLVFFKQSYPMEEIATLIVSGGTAKLPGLISSLTNRINISSQLHNPFLNLSVNPSIVPLLTPDAPIYSTAVGLAIKEV